MKTTIEIPNRLFREAKATAARRGQSLKELFTQALEEKLAGPGQSARAAEPEWMEGFGALRRLKPETRRVLAKIERRFEIIEPEDRA
jgi:hypothetical protein